MKEKALLVTVDFLKLDSKSQDFLSEFLSLSESAGLEVVDNLLFKQKVPEASSFLSKGKVEILGALALREKIDVVIFEHDLSPSQQRNLEELLKTKTIDRTQLILDIFARRAKTSEGKLQVELAQLKYLLPRLVGKGIYLSRLGGGVGTRGPGEQKLEVDRRRIRDRIVKLGRELKSLQARRVAGIQKKKEKELPLVALVGYTPAGKSSLFNALTFSSMPVKHKLFSTLDTTTRLAELPSNTQALLVDTVGFIRNLPHHLIESFKATLEEAIHADLLLHVVDATSPHRADVEQAVEHVLASLGIHKKKSLRIYNKIDNLSAEGKKELFEECRASKDKIALSVHTKEGLQDLRVRLAFSFNEHRQRKQFFIPTERLGLVHFLYESAEIITRRDEADGAYFHVYISAQAAQTFNSRLSKF